MHCNECGTSLDASSRFCQQCGTLNRFRTPVVVPANISPTPTHGTVTASQPAVSAAANSLYLPASAGRRLGNYFLDMIGSSIWSVILTTLIGLAGFNALMFSVIVSILSTPMYYAFFEGIWQRTPGKYVTRTKVVRTDGTKPEFSEILGRSFARIVPFEPFSFLFNSHPVGWHDRWSGTLVVPKDFTVTDVQKIDLKSSVRSSGAVIASIILTAVAVIVIIGILSSIVLLTLNSARGKGRDARRIADIKQLQLGAELYYSDHNEYPISLSDLGTRYLSLDATPAAVPTDPVSGNMYDYFRCTPTTYHIGASLEDNNNPALQKDRDSSSMCAGDTVNGSDVGPCATGETGYCFDLDSNAVSAPAQ